MIQKLICPVLTTCETERRNAGACELQARGNILLSTEAAQNFAGFQFRRELEPFSVQVLFGAGKTRLSDSKKRLKKAYKTDLQASCTSNSSYTMAFR